MPFESISLPRGWPARVRSALLQSIGLVRMGWLAVAAGFEDGPNPRAALIAQGQRLREELAIAQEVSRILRERLSLLEPHRRPFYAPKHRLDILTLRARAGWNTQQTAERFLVTAATIGNWSTRLDEAGPDALVQTHRPVNRFPDFVATLVQHVSAIIPSGRRRLAQVMARAGLRLSASTVGRMRKKTNRPVPEPQRATAPVLDSGRCKGVVRAKHVHHLWHVDITLVPTALGFWVPWFPYSIAQCWPFCWHVVAVVDHFSRAVLSLSAFRCEPKAEQVCGALDSAVKHAGRTPRHIVSDRGSQFGELYRRWCDENRARPRWGALGQHGSIAVIERFFRSLKQEFLGRILVPLGAAEIDAVLGSHARWFNEHRPHAGLNGLSPSEMTRPGRKQRLLEPRKRYPIRRASGVAPVKRCTAISFTVELVDGHPELPVLHLQTPP